MKRVHLHCFFMKLHNAVVAVARSETFEKYENYQRVEELRRFFCLHRLQFPVFVKKLAFCLLQLRVFFQRLLLLFAFIFIVYFCYC